MSAYRNGLTKQQIIDLTGSKEEAEGIVSVSEIVSDYAHFRSIIDLGFQVHHSEYNFDKVMLFSWIKEAIDNERKDRVSNHGNQR